MRRHRTPGAVGSALLFLTLGVVPSLGAQDTPDIKARVKAIQKSAIVIDTHDDTPQRMLWADFDMGHRDAEGDIDIPRMREGGLNAIFMSIWTPGTLPTDEAIRRALQQIDAVKEQVRKYPNDLMLAETVADVGRAREQGKIAVLMGMEGGHMINNDLGLLRQFAGMGVRYLTLTHSVNDDWADSSTDKPAHNGLTPFGKQVVTELNRLGVMVDISHVSDKTFYDVLEITRAPVIASHSSCRAVCDAKRNMSDDMIRALAKNGGVMQINFHEGFLSQQYADATKTDEGKALMAGVEKSCGDNEACKTIGYQKASDEATAAGKLPKVSWTVIVDHIDHAVKIGGAEHVGLGSDFDGAVMPQGMNDVTHYPQLIAEMARRGYSDKDILNILGGNVLRVMTQAEETAKKMKGEKK